MAEIEYFVDPQNKSHPKFNSLSKIKLPLLSGKDQE
jgi:glycyl-tRNA synthetase (class II)